MTTRAPVPPVLERATLRALAARLGAGLLERDTAVRCLLLAALAGEHMLLVGPPGSAKSALARRLGDVCGGRTFTRLVNRFTVPEELFGPLSLGALDAGRYEREIEGWLPTATVAFLDEVFKAGSPILNTLLTLLEERFFEQGTQRLRVPLRTVVAASNEWPDEDGLDAFVDRFLFRVEVAPVSDAAFGALLAAEGTADAPGDEAGIGSLEHAACPVIDDRLRAQLAEAAQAVALPGPIVAVLSDLRRWLRSRATAVSDRRWVRSARVLRVAAAAAGRTEVDVVDLWLLRFVVACDAQEAAALGEWLATRVGAHAPLEPVRLHRIADAFEHQLEIERNATELALDDAGKLSLARTVGGVVEPGEAFDAAPRLSAFSRRRRFSASHVRARCDQLDAVIGDADDFLTALDAHRRSLLGRAAEDPWLEPAAVAALGVALDGTDRAVRVTRERLAGVRGAFAALPLAEVDDGSIPAPVGTGPDGGGDGHGDAARAD